MSPEIVIDYAIRDLMSAAEALEDMPSYLLARDREDLELVLTKLRKLILKTSER